MQPIGFSYGSLIYSFDGNFNFGPAPALLKLAVPLNSLIDSLIYSLSYFSNISRMLLSFLSNTYSFLGL